MTDATKTFHISITGDVELTVAEVWPDGDAPENPTADDVAEVMLKSSGGRATRLISDWCLPCEIAVDGVDVIVEG